MSARLRSSILLMSTLALACATEASNGDSTVQTPGDPGAAAPVAQAEADVEVDERPPVPLAQWREVKKDGDAASNVADLDERIAKCRTFVKEHPEHQATGDVLESLADALVEKGGFDPQELANCLEAKAALEDESSVPTELVQRYHLKHDLPIDSGLRLLEMARERLDQDEKELELEDDERRREWMGLRLAYSRAKADAFEARLHLRNDQLDEALQALERGQAETAKLARGIAVVDGEGTVVRTMAAGVLEQLDILRAETLHRKGDDEAAREALGKALGFLDDIEVRGMYDELRSTLGSAGNTKDQLITARPRAAQAFELENLKGKNVKLSDYRGKVVLVTFWATWCGPCKREMPELQKFQQENRDKGVVVVAVNIDDFNSRSKIAPFMKDNNLTEIEVLFEEPKQLTDYNYRAIPALYVIDREGRVAHARTGYDPELKEKLAHEITEIVEGKQDSGRKLLTIEQAPAGWEVLWKQPVSGGAGTVAVAPAVGKAGAEIGAVGRAGLMRWSADGESLGTKPLSGWTRSLQATDLDGDGQREWLVGGYRDFKVLDHDGELYWQHSGKGGVTIADVADLNGDGFDEIITQDSDRVVAMKAVPDAMWTSAPFKELEAVTLDPAGGLLVQADGELTSVSNRGRVTARHGKAPEGRSLSGRIDTPDGPMDIYRGEWDPKPTLDHDIDGDGRDDVLVAGRQGVIVYDQQGQPLLRVRSHDVGIKAAVGELDGKPGAELVLMVDHYGLVVLGKKQ